MQNGFGAAISSVPFVIELSILTLFADAPQTATFVLHRNPASGLGTKTKIINGKYASAV